jgi:hypothetical protein
MHDDTPNDTLDAIAEQFTSTGPVVLSSYVLQPELLIDDDFSAEIRGRYNFQRMMHFFFVPLPSSLLQPWQAG